MDSLNYHYYAGTNRLKHISDNVDDGAYRSSLDRLVSDIDNQPQNNYAYDHIGNLIKDSAEKITHIKWSVYGKIQEITKNVDGAITTIKYTYDALGNRISKTVIPPSGGQGVTWYVRDAQGNLLSTYSSEGDATDLAALPLKQTERYLYGSSRLGVIAGDANVDGGPADMYDYNGWTFSRGMKQYELTNHLGNVLAVVSDKKFGVPSDTNSSLIDYYLPHIVSAQDYYPFGMPSRVAPNYGGTQYKFGFNGKEQDDEVKGFGSQQDYGMRVYDPRAGRFLSVDPLSKSYPWNSPYSYAEGDPINYVDIDGAEKGGQTAQSIPRLTRPTIDPGIIKPGWDDPGGTKALPPVTSVPRTYTAPSWLDKIDYGKYVPPYAQTATIVQNPHGIYVVGQTINGTNYVIPIYEVPEKREVTWVDRLVLGIQQEKLRIFNSNITKWNDNIQDFEIITTDPLTLTDDYLERVNRRLINGTATDQDRLYSNEVAARKNLGSINDPEKVTFIQKQKGGEARKVMVDLPKGFKKTKLRSQNQPVFTNGKLWITPDQTGHKGGIWKVFDSEKNVGSTNKSKRLGTYDANLNRVDD